MCTMSTTSTDGGAAIGVERYLGKPYQENDLLQNVREALGQGATDGVN